MSTQDDRRAEGIIPAQRVTGIIPAERAAGFIPPGPAPVRRKRWLLWAISILAVLFILQVAYQLFLSDRSFADPERIKAMAKLSLKRAGISTKDWPGWRGPNRDGVSAETNLLTVWPENGPPKLWERPAGGGYSSLAVAAGRVYTILQDGSDEAAVCWDAKKGKELWRFRYPALYRNDYGNGPRSTPMVDGDYVYTVGGTGILHCLKTHPATPAGESVWHKDLLTDFGAKNLNWGVSFSPLVQGDLVYTMPGGPGGNSLAAFDKKTGNLKWKNLDDLAGYSSPIAATIAGTPQIIFFTGLGLVGVSPSDGTLLWRFPWETNYGTGIGANIATPIVVEDYVFISSGYRRGCALIHIEKTADGSFQANRVYENKNMCNHFPSSILIDGHLYGFDDSRLTCMEFTSGKVRWKKSGFDKGTVLGAGKHLIILGETGKLALADASPEGYREIASCQIVDGKCWTVPVLADGRLYLRDEKTVMCLDLRNKK
jgi:outer membrane protein assembly factor BamB